MPIQKTVLFLILSTFTFVAFGLKALSSKTADSDSSMPGMKTKAQAAIVVLTVAMWIAFILVD